VTRLSLRLPPCFATKSLRFRRSASQRISHRALLA
jgi:hypothetical protein